MSGQSLSEGSVARQSRYQVLFGAMLAGVLGAYEMAARGADGKAYRAAAGLGPAAAFLLTGFFVALWLGSALLFRESAREQAIARSPVNRRSGTLA